MTTADPSIPTPREELGRKAVDELARLAQLVDAQRITRAEFGQIATSIWNVISGLVDLDISEIAARASTEYGLPERRRSWFKDGDVTSIFYFDTKPDYLIVRRGISHVTELKRTVPCDPLDRPAVLKSLSAALVKAGWAEI